MICIYSQNNTNYQANGDAVLEPMSCDLEITINGAWSLTLEHPYDPEGKYKYIVEGAVIRADIRCIRELTGVRQLFRVYNYKKGLHSVTAIAFPVAMEATHDAPIDNLVIQNKTGSQAMTDLQAFTNKYTLATDITKVASSSFSNTNVNSAIASGSNNCFLKIWGGEILYDNLTFNVKNRIGDTEAGDHQITYGRNLTDITYTKDDSGLITRIYPISQDGIRLSGDHFVNSPKIYDYPVVHSQFMQAPYTLINTDASSPSQTAQQTRTSGAAVRASAAALAQASYEAALALGFEPEYIKEIRQEIISAVTTMALENVISTSLYNYLSGIIADAMSFLSELEQPAWSWLGSWEDGWKYGNVDGYAVNKYVKIGKTWSYFNAEGYWEEPRDDKGDWDWYQTQDGTGRMYGDFEHYYAHNEYVYITMSGTLTKYYFDADGWYDDSKTEASTWEWHGSGTSSDPYWFGESGASSEETTKYAHDCWLFIDGSLYFFDHFGYYTPGNKFEDYRWDWVETSDGFWFGNAEDPTYGAVYLEDQWAKINGTWTQFAGGYVMTENQSLYLAVYEFTNGMAGLKTVVNAQKDILYDLLDDQMIAYANSRFAAGVDVPAVTITVDMADLSKTTEYAGFENLETVKLGDAVICTDNEHNISMTSRVIGLTYDCIRDFNSTVVIGKAGASIASIVGNANSEVVSGGFDTTAIETQIAALQNKVGDVFMNNASIVTNGVARFELEAGDNMTMERSGNKIRFNSTASGGTGDVSMYHGVMTPEVSLGDNNDIYVQLAPSPTSFKSLEIGGVYNGVKSWTMTNVNKVYHYTSVWQPGYMYHAGQGMLIPLAEQLTPGKKYLMHLDVISINGIWNDSGDTNQGEFYGIAYQKQNNVRIHDGRIVEHVANGGFEYLSQFGSGIYYQSFIYDHERHSYEFEFEATRDGYFMIYGDGFADSGEYNLEITNMYLTDGESEIPVITDIYYKIEGEWLSNENAGRYVAGANISIDGNVISADLSSRIPNSEKGTASGVAELDANGKVPSAQLPSFVDDVIEGYLYNGAFYEDSAHQTLITPQDGKIYIDLTTEKTYRWSGSAYVEISASLALGETSSTAYRGDRGKTAYDHSQLTSGNPHNVTKTDVGLGNVGNFKAVSTVANQGLSTTEKVNARTNIGSPTKTSDLQNDSNFVVDANYEHLPLTVVNGKLCIVYET